MKKQLLYIVMMIIMVGLSLPAVAQLKWNITEDATVTHQLQAYLGESDLGFGFVFAVPREGMFKDNGYSFSFCYFNNDMKIVEQQPLPGNTPSYLGMRGFNGTTAIYGSGDDNHKDKGNAVLMFLDQQRQEVGRKEWKLSGDRHLWYGGCDTYITYDSSYFIAGFTEQCVPDKPSMAADPEVRHEVVYDRDLKLVWEGDYEDHLFQDRQKNQFVWGRDFTTDGKLLVYGTETVKKNSRFIAYTLDNGSGQATKVVDEELPFSAVSTYSEKVFMKAYVNAANQLFVFMYQTCEFTTKQMLFLRVNLSNTTDKNKQQYTVDKTLTTVLPMYKGTLKEFPLIREVYPWNNGFIVAGEYLNLQSSGIVNVKDLSLFKFGSDGNVEWVNTLQKENYLSTVDLSMLMSVFPSGDELTVFYCDIPENVRSKEFIPGKRPILGTVLQNTECLAVAKIRADGQTAYRSVLSIYKETKVKPNLSFIFSAGDNRYLITGGKDGINAFSLYTAE